MTKLEIAKKATSIIVGLGTSKVVGDIVKTNTQPKNLFDKISIGAATLVAGTMASTATKAHSDKMIDEAVEAFAQLKKN